MASYKKVATALAHNSGPDRFIVMREEVISSELKELLGYEKGSPAVKLNYFMEDIPGEEKMEMVEKEIRANMKLGLEFTGNNFLMNHHEQIRWTDESIIKFLDTCLPQGKMNGIDIGMKKPDYKNKVGIPVGLYRLQMLSVCLNRSDMMGMTHYNGEVINSWVKKNKSKFIGKCIGSLNKDEWDIISRNAYVYVNNFFENDMDESYEMNKYCLENISEEDKVKLVDRCDNLFWFWQGEF